MYEVFYFGSFENMRFLRPLLLLLLLLLLPLLLDLDDWLEVLSRPVMGLTVE